MFIEHLLNKGGVKQADARVRFVFVCMKIQSSDFESVGSSAAFLKR